MPASGVSRADENRRIRQDELRAKLSAGRHVDDVIDNAEKIQNLDTPLEPADIQRLKIASELKLKLIAKYLPDMKAVEHTGDVSAELTHNLVQVEYVSGNESSDS